MRFLLLIVTMFKFSFQLVPNNRQYSNLNSLQSNLKVVSAQQTSVIAQTWYRKIIENFYAEVAEKGVPQLSVSRRLERSRYNHILQHINKLEGMFQSPQKDKYLYLAWMPQEKKSRECKEVLSLVIFDAHTDANQLCLKCIVQNPCWHSENISIKELKKCIDALENEQRIVNSTTFLEKPQNVRFKLDWSL